jgi:secondary thiamine-phosphate synthase enzyme
MHTRTLTLDTGSREAVVDLTHDVSAFLSGLGEAARAGLLTVFVPHATAGVAILELGSGSDEDLLRVLADLLPADGRYRHAHGSRGHGRSHVMPALIAPSIVVPVADGRPMLGTWQSVALVDLNVDNATRSVHLAFLAG